MAKKTMKDEPEAAPAEAATGDAPEAKANEYPRMVFRGEDPQLPQNQHVVNDAAGLEVALASGWRVESLPPAK